MFWEKRGTKQIVSKNKKVVAPLFGVTIFRFIRHNMTFREFCVMLIV